jgi:antitoxin CptB
MQTGPIGRLPCHLPRVRGPAYRAVMTKAESAAEPGHAHRLARMKFRAWHRGTREADYMIGCFFDRYCAEWAKDGDEAAMVWFEALLDEDDVEIMAWALGTASVPAAYAGPQMEAMRRLDYVTIPR